MIDNTMRFSDRVDNYQKFRPSYTSETVDYIFNNFGLSQNSSLADIGSGTGIFTETLLPRCKTVFAVEPNPEMRKAADKRLSSYTSYKAVNGTSEKTSLRENAVDGITAAQAFHWFNIEETKKEFNRILRNDGYVFLIWNKRIANTAFLQAYEKILTRSIPDYSELNHNNITPEIMKAFLINNYEEAVFKNKQIFTLDGVLGRVSSSSYTPKQETEEFKMIEKEIVKAFNQYSAGGLIEFNYNTVVYSGKIT